jgi:hypothetical protein
MGKAMQRKIRIISGTGGVHAKTQRGSRKGAKGMQRKDAKGDATQCG